MVLKGTLFLKSGRIALLLFIAISIFCACYVFIAETAYKHSPWSSESKVRQMLLALTPMGSSINKVRTVMQEQKWKVWYEKRLPQAANSARFPGVRGSYAIGVDFGEHSAGPLRYPYGVDAYWGFDDNGKMIDLRVRLMAHGL